MMPLLFLLLSELAEQAEKFKLPSLPKSTLGKLFVAFELIDFSAVEFELLKESLSKASDELSLLFFVLSICFSLFSKFNMALSP